MSIINGALAGFGKGLAEVGTAYARDSEKDQDRLLREKLQEERLTSQRELQDAKLEAKIAAATGGGSGKGQNFDKEQLDLYAKLQLSDDGTVPGGDKYLKAITTGDTSALQTAVPATEGNNPSAYVAPSGNMELTEKTRTLLVEKAKVLSQIAKERGFGSAYDDIEKGERTALGNEAARGIIKGKLSDPEKLLAIEGKPLFKGGASGVTNQATGEQELNAYGEAQANKANRAPVGKGGGSGKDRTEQDVNARLETLRKDEAKILEAMSKNRGTMSPEEKKKANDRLAEIAADRAAARANSKFKGATPAASAASAPRKFTVLGRE